MYELLYFDRYRYDCLVLWNGTDEKVQELYNFFNTVNLDVNFTVEIGNQSVCFLDLSILIIGKKLTITIYCKPADSHLYLHAVSCHKILQLNVFKLLLLLDYIDNDYIAKSKVRHNFCTSKNSMIMSNFSAKENTNVEDKSENESGIRGGCRGLPLLPMQHPKMAHINF